MSNLQKTIDSVQKLIEHLEIVTGVPAIPVKEQPKQKAPKQDKKAAPAVELPPLVASFAKCELRVTQVKTCQTVDYSDKLLLMTLDIGNGQTRTFAAGVSAYYKPEEMIGKKICTILNLKARPMCEGKITSEAMLFAGSYGEEDNRVVKLCFPSQDVPVGTRVVVDGFPELPEVDGQPKKHFDKVLEELKALDGCMALGGMKLLAGGKAITVDVPNGSHLG